MRLLLFLIILVSLHTFSKLMEGNPEQPEKKAINKPRKQQGSILGIEPRDTTIEWEYPETRIDVLE